MKVAISTDGDFVSAHFGRCPSFTLVEINNRKVMIKELIKNPGHQPDFIPQFLRERGVECIVAGGMGMRAQGFFSEAGIQTILGANGEVENVIERLRKGTIKGGKSLCTLGAGKGYGIEKAQCDHPHHHEHQHNQKHHKHE